MLVTYNPDFAHELLLSDHLDDWLAEGRERWRTASYELYESLVRLHIVPRLGDRHVTLLRTEDVRTWQREMADNGVGVVTRKRAHQLAASALQRLADEGRIARNVFRAVKPPQPPKPEVYVPGPDELRRLIEACTDAQSRAIVILAATTLLRIGELLALRVRDDVDLERKRLFITGSLGRDSEGKTVRGLTKTKASRRIVALPELAASAIAQHLATRTLRGVKSPWLFASECGPIERHNFRSRVWLPLLKAASLPLDMHFHALRHAGNSLLLDAGVPVLVVAARCGHADTRMTLDRYGHIVRAGADSEAAAITDRIFADILKGRDKL